MTNQQITIDYLPFPYQADMHLSDHRFKCIVGGRRSGKTLSALHESIKFCLLNENSLVWWVAQTYKDAKEVGFEMFLDHLHELEPALENVHTTNLQVHFINGSKLFFKGSDNPNSLRGRGLDLVVLDEAAFQKEAVWTKALRPALSDKQGKAIFVTTPNGRNWFYNLYTEAGYESRTKWSQLCWPTELNPLISKEELDEARSNLSQVDFEQEYLAKFVTKGGLIYQDFNESNIIKPTDLTDHTHDFYLGMDFGFANPTAICFMAVDRVTQQVIQFDELYATRTPIEKIIEQLKEKISDLKITIKAIYTDPAGNAEELSSGLSPVDLLRKAGFQVVNKGTRITPGLALVRSFIKAADGSIRYHVTNNCDKTIDNFYGYSYKTISDRQTEDPDKSDGHDHMMDAIRYFFVNRFDNAKYIYTEVNQFNPSIDRFKKTKYIKRCGGCRRTFISHSPKHIPPFNCKECS